LRDLEKKNRLIEQTRSFPERVKIQYLQEIALEAILKEERSNLSTMGRGFDEDREFFLTAAAGGVFAAKKCGGENG